MVEERQKAWWQRPRWWAIGATVLLALILADVIAAFALPPRTASHITTASPADQLRAEADLRSAILSLLGALTPLVALIAGIVAVLNFQETRRQNVASLEVIRRGQVTDRFTKAIEQLGRSDDKQLDTRMGGIYALEQIAKDSEELHWPVMQVLMAYLREHSPRKESMQGRSSAIPPVPAPADFLAIASVLRRRRWQWDPVATFDEDGQRWGGAVWLEGCDLRIADFQGAHFEGAWFQEAQLQGANFAGAHLAKAGFRGTLLQSTRFHRADLHGADLREVDLTLTKGLSQEQLDSAVCDATTKPPPGLTILISVKVVVAEPRRSGSEAND